MLRRIDFAAPPRTDLVILQPGLGLLSKLAMQRLLDSLAALYPTARKEPAVRVVPQKHAWRAEIVLLTADGLGTVEIMRRTGKSKTCVWRWQERFAAEGVDGLLRDKTRPPRVPPLGQGFHTFTPLTATGCGLPSLQHARFQGITKSSSLSPQA